MTNIFTPSQDQDSFDDVLESLNIDTETTDVYQEPEQWTIIEALNRVLCLARGSRLSKEFWEKVKNPLDYLVKELGLTDVQVVFLTVMIESGGTMSWRKFGNFFNCSRLSTMIYTEEMDDLISKRWVERRNCRDLEGRYEGFSLAKGVITALRHNTTYVPEKIDGLDIQGFIDRLEKRIDVNADDGGIEFCEDELYLKLMCKSNPQLPLCRTALSLGKENIHNLSLLLMLVYDFAQWADSDDEGLTLRSIDKLYPRDFECGGLRHDLKSADHILFRAGLIEHKCVDGVADTERYMLTHKCKMELLEGYEPSRSKCDTFNLSTRELTTASSIKEKVMYYNATEKEQIERLTSLLSKENLPGIQRRLGEEGMRKGFACIFYGAPGTGKTETVLQLARQTGRDIMQIDIAAMRDKFVGESEKNIKRVFARYRRFCKQLDVTPILFFNEADAIFGKRTSTGTNPTVEKMENSMQNILLEEIESLDGILIATTNLTQNLDDAFERRFLFKVNFEKPEADVKAKLWLSMLGDNLNEEEAERLACKYDFSGGQIENIARKRTIEFILSGHRSTFDDIDNFCHTEMLDKKSGKKSVGFNLHYSGK